MNNFIPWIRIILATFVYILFAMGASIVVRRGGDDLKEIEGRTSQRILVIGAIANLCVLVITLLMLRFLDGRPISSLGLSLPGTDLTYSIAGTAAIFALATIFVGLLGRTRTSQVTVHLPVSNRAGGFGLASALLVLLIVAVQEEVLYRGYFTSNLLQFGPTVVIIASTVLFAAIHLLTNRASVYQIGSWLLAGAVFAYVYLVSGSILVPIVLHFATDATNLLVFNIVGQFSLFTIIPTPNDRQRATYRLVYAAALVALLLAFLGTTIRLT
jgi:membrane protease YdiL (CAAX protease family)